MAIVIEEEKSGNGASFAVIFWILILVVILVGLYYVFFKKPELIQIAPPADLSKTVDLSKIELNPEQVINNPNFKDLKNFITPSEPKDFGRTNPFLAF